MSVEHLLCINGHTQRIWSIAWSPTDDIFATCSADRNVKIWRLKKEQTHNNELHFCSLGSKNCGRSYSCILEYAITKHFKKTVRCVKFSPDGKYLLCASFDGTTTIWNCNGETREWDCLATLEGHENEVKCVAMDSTGRYIATCGRDKTVWVYEKAILKISDDENDNDSPNFYCSAILTGHTHAIFTSFRNIPSSDVKYVAWNPMMLLLASASYDNGIKVWEFDDGEWVCIQTLSLHEDTVWCLSFSLDGTQLVSCSADKSVIIYESKIAKEHFNRHKISQLHIGFYNSPIPIRYPKSLIQDKLSTYRSIRANDWRPVHVYGDLHNRPIYSVDYDRYILTGGGDNEIKILEVGREWIPPVAEVKGHESDVNGVAWKPLDSEFIFASVGDDEYIKLWKLIPESVSKG